jgi:hypothetical protein
LSADEAAERRRAGARRLAREGYTPPEADQPAGDESSESEQSAPASPARRRSPSNPLRGASGSFSLNPTKVQARKMVLVSMLLLFAIQMYRDRKVESPQGTYRTFWAVGVVGLFLSLLADFVPQIAGPFAALVVLGSLTNGGEAALTKLVGVVGTAPGGGATTTATKTAATTTAHAPPGVQGPKTH